MEGEVTSPSESSSALSPTLSPMPENPAVPVELFENATGLYDFADFAALDSSMPPLGLPDPADALFMRPRPPAFEWDAVLSTPCTEPASPVTPEPEGPTVKVEPDVVVPADAAPAVAPRALAARARAAEPRLGSPEQRRTARLQALARFRSKRASRSFAKKVRYECRKQLADSRPRVKGRFVKKSEMVLFRKYGALYRDHVHELGDQCVRSLAQ